MSFSDVKESSLGMIPKSWDVVTLEECIDLIIDYRGKTPKKLGGDWSNNGIKAISAKNIKNGRIVREDTIRYLDENLYSKWMKEEIKFEDIIMTSEAPLGECLLWNSDEKVVLSQRLYGIRLNKKIIYPKYMYSYMNSHVFKYELDSRASGTTVLGIRQSELLKTRVILPPLREQKVIGNTIDSINNKIEINNKINKNLEEMAQAIFKQWFIDFEFSCIPENYKFSGAGKPCNLESAGKPHDFDKVCTYKRVGGLPIPDGDSWFVYVLLCEDGSFYKGITKDLYRRFYEHYTGIGAEWTKTHKPVKVIHYEKFSTQEEARKREEELKSGFGREWIKREYKKYIEGSPAHQTRLVPAGEMVESELGMIPKGWSVTELNSIGNLTMGLSPKSSSYNTNQEGYPLLNGAADFNGGLITPTKYTTQETRLCNKGDLVFCIRATIGNITFADKKYCLGRGVASIESKDQIYKGLIYMNLDKSIEKLKAQATGSVILGLSKPDINNMKIVLPHIELIKQYSKCFNDIYELKKVNELENQRIQELRDTLLPKLMSGEIRVNID